MISLWLVLCPLCWAWCLCLLVLQTGAAPVAQPDIQEASASGALEVGVSRCESMPNLISDAIQSEYCNLFPCYTRNTDNTQHTHETAHMHHHQHGNTPTTHKHAYHSHIPLNAFGCLYGSHCHVGLSGPLTYQRKYALHW